MSQSEDAIKVEGLTKVFNNSLVAVDNISFTNRNLRNAFMAIPKQIEKT